MTHERKKGALLLVGAEWGPFTLREVCLLSLNNGSNFLIIIESFAPPTHTRLLPSLTASF